MHKLRMEVVGDIEDHPHLGEASEGPKAGHVLLGMTSVATKRSGQKHHKDVLNLGTQMVESDHSGAHQGVPQTRAEDQRVEPTGCESHPDHTLLSVSLPMFCNVSKYILCRMSEDRKFLYRTS